ncbi:MAG: hypothetical protein ABI421_09205 [Polyangiaceae bacterium]
MTTTSNLRERVFSGLKIVLWFALALAVARLAFSDPGLDDEELDVHLAHAPDPNCLRTALVASFGTAAKPEAHGNGVHISGPACLARQDPKGMYFYVGVSGNIGTLTATTMKAVPECEAIVRATIAKAITSYVAACDPDTNSWTAACRHSGYGSRTCAPIVSSEIRF